MMIAPHRDPFGHQKAAKLSVILAGILLILSRYTDYTKFTVMVLAYIVGNMNAHTFRIGHQQLGFVSHLHVHSAQSGTI